MATLPADQAQAVQSAPGILAMARPARQTPRYVKILIYGVPGVGKTRMAGGIIDVKELIDEAIVLDIEGGTLTLHEMDINVLRVKGWKELVGAYKELHRMCYAPEYSGPRYQAAVLDSITELQKLNMGDIMTEVVKANSDRDRYVPSQREWGKSSEMVREIIRRFRDLPMHVIMTALAKEEKQGDDGPTYIRPSLPGKLAAEVSGFMDIVGYMFMDSEVVEVTNPDGTKKKQRKLVRKMLVQPTATVIAKDRTGKLGLGLREPTMRKLMEPILGLPQTDGNSIMEAASLPGPEMPDEEAPTDDDGDDVKKETDDDGK